MIYHKVIAGRNNPTDITAACPDFMDYKMAAGSGSAAVSFSGRLNGIDVEIASRECGLTLTQLEAKLAQACYYTLYSGGTSIALSLVATDLARRSELIHNDKLDADFGPLGYHALDASVSAAARDFLFNFYWPADISGLNPDVQIDKTRPRIAPEPGPYLREWPGLRVESSEAVKVDEFALSSDGACIGDKIYDYSLALDQPAPNSIRIGQPSVGLTGSMKTVALTSSYALRGVDWENVTDYASSLAGAITTTAGEWKSAYNPPRALYGSYEIVSRAYLVARCDADSDYDAGAADNAYGYFQWVQSVGPVRPEPDATAHKVYQSTPTVTRDTEAGLTGTVYGLRERQFVTDGLDDIIGVEGAFPDDYWYFIDDDETLFGPDSYARPLYLPVKTRIVFAWGGTTGKWDTQGEQKPAVKIYRVERDHLRTMPDLGDVAGADYFTGLCDPAAHEVADLTESAEVTLDPGWYAIGALGDAVKLNRIQHPTIFDWNGDGEDSGKMTNKANRVSFFTITLKPIEPCYLGRTCLDGTDLYCQHLDVSPGSWFQHCDTARDYRSYIYNGTTFTEDAAPGGQAFFAKSGGTAYTVANPLSGALGNWRYPWGCHQGRGIIKIYDGTRWRYLEDNYTAGPEAQLSILDDGDKDVEVTGVSSDGAGGLLIGVRIKTPVLERAAAEVRRVDWDYPDWDGRGTKGGFRLRGDKTELFPRKTKLRLYIPPYKRGWYDSSDEYQGPYEQTKYTYPLTHTAVDCVYDSDDNRTWVNIDPPPDQSSAIGSHLVDIQPLAIQFWDAEQSHEVEGVEGQPLVFIEQGTPEPRCQLWRVTAAALGVVNDTISYSVVATATETVNETVDFSWDGENYSAEIDRNIDPDSIELDFPHSVNLVDGKWTISTARRVESADLECTAYSPLPYQPGDDYIYQGGKLYQWDGSLTRVYADHGLPAAPLCGDMAEIVTGIYAAPVYIDGSTRMVVVDTLRPNYGMGLKPLELDSDSTWQDVLGRYRDIGLICNRASYQFHYPKNAAVLPLPTVEEAYIVDHWQESHWADSTTLPGIVYENGTYPATLSVTGETETSTAVNAADARAYRNTLGALFIDGAPRTVLVVRINETTLALADKLGYTCAVPADFGSTGVLAEVQIDHAAELMTLYFV